MHGFTNVMWINRPHLNGTVNDPQEYHFAMGHTTGHQTICKTVHMLLVTYMLVHVKYYQFSFDADEL